MSHLEKKISEWKKGLRRNPSFEESDIIEMETHLRMLIDKYKDQGLDEDEAFVKAVQRFGEPDKVGEDVYKVRTIKKIVRPSWQESAWMPILFQNYLKTLWRNISRNKFYTSLNLIGLTIGITCCLLIILFIKDELSYDRFHENADRIYRVTVQFHVGSGNHWAPIGPPVAQGLKAAIPEIEQTTRFYPAGGDFLAMNFEDQLFKATDGVYADSTLFQVFSYPLKQGDTSSALVAPRSIVLSRDMAEAFFGDENPIGKTIRVTDWDDFELTVTGVFEKIGGSTHIPFNYAISMSTFYDLISGPNWNPDNSLTWSGFYTYVMLKKSATREEVEEKLPGFLDSFFAQIVTADQQPSEMAEMILQPLTDIHLYSSLEKEYLINGDIQYVYVFGLVAGFVLLIACANFINLTTARAGDRMREIGIRKTLGAGRGQLAFQFLGESILLSFIALVLAYELTILLLPKLNQITGKAFIPEVLFTPTIIWSFIGVSLFSGIISGIYPALHMSSFSPVKVLKGVMSPSSGSALLRKGLVIFQFTISIFLIIGTTVVYNQLHFLRTTQLGFDKEGVINVSLSGEFRRFAIDNSETVKQELLRNPNIISVSIGGDYPGQRFSVESVIPEGRSEEEDITIRIADGGVDHDFISTMGIQIMEGRNFSQQSPTDTTAWLINESAVPELNIENPIGHILHWGNYSGPIVGIVEDFNFASMRTTVEPLVIPLSPWNGNYLFVRAQGENLDEVLAFLNEKINEFVPSTLFEYSFLSDEFNQLYRSEDQMSSVFWYFSIIAILLACLGLFGLSTYIINQRTKEIGVRKVLGASMQNIVMLVSKDFLLLISIAFLIAAPVVYYLMNQWLNSFAYQTDIGLWMFAVTGILVLSISFVTIGYQAFRSAMSNPVKALRSE